MEEGARVSLQGEFPECNFCSLQSERRIASVLFTLFGFPYLIPAHRVCGEEGQLAADAPRWPTGRKAIQAQEACEPRRAT
jgi:hypothetical protein